MWWTLAQIKVNIRVLGMLVIADDVSVELFKETVKHIQLRGKLVSPAGIRKIIEEKG